jgi:transcription initiation factor TFIIIB Brf1 subunit/transcription initiation factor TFIIB
MPRINLRQIAKQKKKEQIEKFKEENNDQDEYSTSDMFKCEGCASKLLIPSDGSMICKNCGLYQSRDIYTGNDSNFNNGTNDKVDTTRVGMATNDLMPELNQSTIINFTGKGKCSNKMNIIKNKTNWASMNYKDATSLNKLKELEMICTEINIPQKMIEEIKNIFYKLNEVISVRNKKLEALKACSIIIAYKEEGIKRDFSQLAKAFKITDSSLRKTIKENEIIWKQLKKKSITTEINKIHELAVNASKNNNDINENHTLSLKNEENELNHIIKQLNDNTNISNIKTILKSNINNDDNDDNCNSNKNNNCNYNSNKYSKQDTEFKKYLINFNTLNETDLVKCINLNHYIIDNKLLERCASKTKYACILLYLINNNHIYIQKNEVKTYIKVSNQTLNKYNQILLDHNSFVIQVL